MDDRRLGVAAADRGHPNQVDGRDLPDLVAPKAARFKAATAGGGPQKTAGSEELDGGRTELPVCAPHASQGGASSGECVP